MDSNNLKFKALSLNVRGIRTFEKRKSIFNWLTKQNSDIFFLQETYSTEKIENQWKKQWFGDIYFAHGSNHSRGVAILIRKSFDFKLKSIRSDEEGRYLILEAIIQDVPFLLVNIYAPNTTTKQSLFFQTLSTLICDEGYNESDHKILLGGDLNVAMDSDLDCWGGNPAVKDSVKCVEDVMMNYDLVDIWRIRNPNTKKFSWRQKSPIIQRRFDYWLIRGVRQGDPLSPSLFIIVLELLALSIRNNDQIKGISVDGSEIKLVIFADDMTSFVRDELSHRTLFDTIDLFSTYSGLKVNHDKTEILLLGNMEASSAELGVNEISKVIKILEVNFTFNHSLFYKLNFESIEHSLRGLLKEGAGEDLHYLEKSK